MDVVDRQGEARAGWVTATAAMSTVACVFPGLATGALAVQVKEDFGVSAGEYGWTIGSFFLAASLTSIGVGRLAQRIGPRRQLRLGLVATALVQLVVAVAVGNFAGLLVCLALAGMFNSMIQTAVNLALSQARLKRLGFAVAAKQSAMPAAAMLGGLAVPALALTVGWRFVFGFGAGLAMAAWVLVGRFVPMSEVGWSGAGRAAGSPRRALIGAAVVSALLAFSSGAINAWTVASGVDAGLGEGVAGAVLSAGAATGIGLRLIAGRGVDTSRVAPFRAAATLSVVGLVGFVALAPRVAWLHVAATFLAFGGGWIWPVFTNFAIVNANPESAGAATGITQSGVYVGVFAAPILTGYAIDAWGYPTMWLLVGAVAVAAIIGSLRISAAFPR